MDYEAPLLEGKLIKRYKRFFADVELADGTCITAHCPNTGSMKTCGAPGDTVVISHNPSPKRKLAYTWQMTRTAEGFIGVNTARPNKIVEEGIVDGKIPELSGYDSCKSEQKYGASSRIDLLLESSDRPPCYVEVKNTTLSHGDYIVFPDAVTARGLKHLEELVHMTRDGARAVMFYLVNRPDGLGFKPAWEIDPKYCEYLTYAVANGLEVLAYRSTNSLAGQTIGEPVPVFLDKEPRT